jgi:hypothetical protein
MREDQAGKIDKVDFNGYSPVRCFHLPKERYDPGSQVEHWSHTMGNELSRFH